MGIGDNCYKTWTMFDGITVRRKYIVALYLSILLFVYLLII